MLTSVPGELVGRAAVLAMGRAALDHALAGDPRLLLVTGEPGIGKSALLAELAGEAERRGARVLRATCWDGAGTPAYWPWIQLLRAAPDPDEAVRPLSGEDSVRSRAEAADARFRRHDSIARLLAGLAADAGVVVVVDDLHLADEASLQLLRFVLWHLGGMPVLVLAAYRDLEAGPSLREVAEGAHVLSLGGLDPAEVGALMAAVAGRPPTPGLAERVWQRSGGNPLFVRELTRLLVARGDADAGGIPDTVRDTLRSRLARLSQPCTELLRAAALLGPAVRPALLGPVADADPELVAEAVAARVLVVGVDGEARFSHDLYRETLVAELGARRRTELHAAIGRVLEARWRAGGPVSAAELAAHLAAAGDPAAARWSALAGREAAGRLAHEEAAGHFRAALDVGAAEPDRGELLLGLAEALERAGDTEAARSAYRDLAGVARRTGDPTALARAALGRHGLGVRFGVRDAETAALLTEAATALPPDAAALRSRVLATLARDLRIPGGTPDRAAATAREATALARSTGDPAAVAAALLAEHDVGWRPGNAPDRLAVVAELAAAADRAGDQDLTAQATLLRAAALMELGDPAGLVELHAYARLADTLGHARGRWGALTRRATLAVIAGDPDRAAGLAEEALALGVQIAQPDAEAVHGTLRLSLGLLGVALPWAGRPPGIDPADPIAPLLPLLHAFGLLVGGEVDQARAALAGFTVAALPDTVHLEFEAVAATTAAAVGSAELRAQLCERLAPHAGRHVVVGGCASYSGAVDHHLGLLCAALGRASEAAGHLARAVAQHERLGAAGWAGLSRRELARVRPAGNVFRRDGDTWTLGYAGREVHLPHAKGLADLAVLLAVPHREVPAYELLGHPGPPPGADPVLDDRARAAYRARLAALDADLDAGADREAERAALVRELTAAAGLGGRRRRLGDEAERARKTVTARIHDTLDRVARAHPELGRHLRDTVHTGTSCRYAPTGLMRWQT